MVAVLVECVVVEKDWRLSEFDEKEKVVADVRKGRRGSYTLMKRSFVRVPKLIVRAG
jgi:hypothetical protein